ncbi:MAG TPA: nuclear transport factor 2 family protein, partial [Pyrinomonadaceae bacterium]
MLKRIIPLVCCLVLVAPLVMAQNSNSSSTTAVPRKVNANQGTPRPAQQATDTAKPAATTTPAARTTQPKPAVTATAAASPSAGVLAAFNKLLEGIRHANVNAVTSVYWNSPRLALFNNNGTVTKGWDQLRKNRESSYPDVKDVKLDVRDLSVTMLGRDAAVVTCLWNQSQTYKGTPESATGRMTLVFKRVGNEWKVIHLHTSPEAPPASTVMPSEQTPTPKPSPTP